MSVTYSNPTSKRLARAAKDRQQFLDCAYKFLSSSYGAGVFSGEKIGGLGALRARVPNNVLVSPCIFQGSKCRQRKF